MSENFLNTSSAKTNSFNKGMVKDYTDIYMSEGLWINAINAINNAHYGETGSIGNEPSNKFCTSTPYSIIGHAYITQNRWVIFSTNNTNSEIGIFDESDCSYTTTVNDNCLGFKKTHLISAVVKKNYDCTYSVYFADNLNPDRAMNLSRVPYKVIGDANADPDCYEPQYSDELDCDALRLHPLVDQPCVTVKKAMGAGQLNNGSYMACVAYSENGIRLTDYSIPSQPQALWDHTGIGGGIEIDVTSLDQNFEEYELVVIATVNQQTIAKKIGNYSIRQKQITLDLFQQSLPTVDLAQIPLKSVVYEKSEKLFDVNGYLIRSGVTTQPYFNYQLLANQIQTEWVAVEYPADYYWSGGNKTGYMRDEVYPFFIRWVYKTGARSASFHIPGRVANAVDVQSVSTADVVYPTETKNWQVYDTSTRYNATGSTADGGVIIAKGLMGYWESTERYPDDNQEVWGALCGKPIRHHKMPGNETTHIHSQGGDKIVVLGVEFSNIKHPVDSNNVPIADIVGYEILRGSREGNRSIIAKGMFNNMQEYNIQGSSRKGLFQNYPYNDLRPDSFLTDDYGVLDEGSGNPAVIDGSYKLDKYKRDIFSFHSVETTFIKPYIGDGAYVKMYTEERGTVRGRFEFPHKHPKHIILTDVAFTTAAIVGAGIAFVAALGKTTTSGEIWVAPFGTGTAQKQSSESTPGTTIASIISGTVLNPIGFALQSGAGLLALSISSAYYFGQAGDQVLDVVRNLSKTRQYMLQYNSHGFYDKYAKVSNSAVPSGLSQSIRRPVAITGVKYIGAGLHDLDANYRINNLYRNKYVAVKLNGTVPDPASTQDRTKHRVRDGGVSYDNPNGNEVLTDTVAYYGALKVDFQNQYGQLQTVVQLPTGSCVYATQPLTTTSYSTDVIFGGDIYINRYTEKNPYFFFNTWMYDMPDKTEYDYRNYVNGPAPRYWANFEKFDMNDFDISLLPNGLSGPPFGFTTPSSFHRLDRQSSASGTFSVRNSYAYLFHNGVRDFFTESELNMAFRDYGENDYEKFYDVYGNSFNDLSTMFRSDMINKPIYHKYDLSLSTSKLFNNFASWGTILPRDYNPGLYTTCFEYYPNRAVYSLQQQDGLRRDNWRNFLPLNYKDFKGRINTIKSLNATGAMILFENAEPVMFVGVDQLQTQGGVKVSIGDGGLFQGNMQAIVNADDTIGYANSISSRAAVNTPHGLFFVSQQSGKIIQYQGGLSEISSNGMKFWFNQNLPSKMLQAYPHFPLYDNPVAGIGVQAIYDPNYELVYFTKRDYIPLRNDLHFDDPSGVPYYICSTAPVPAPQNRDEGVAPGTGVCKAPLDIAFVLDITSSMQDVLDNLRSSIAAIAADAVVKSNNDYRFGLITVDEYFYGPAVNTPRELMNNNNIDTFTLALNSFILGSGGDEPEPTDVAIQSVIDGALGAFRPNAIKMIVMMTDARPSGGDDYYNPAVEPGVVQNIANNAAAAGIKIYPIATGIGANFQEVLDIHNIYANTTGGVANIAPTGQVGNIISDELLNVPCPPAVNCLISASNTVINQGQSTVLSWDGGGGSIVTLNGTSVATNGSLTVTPTVTTTYLLISQSGEIALSCSVTITVIPTPITKCPCEFTNPECFTPCDWTISYDPKTKQWVSFHDWMPSLMMPSYKHFFTIKNNAIWRHNDRWDSFCNYYGTDYPWEVEYPVVTPNNITTLRSIEYTLDVYKFYNDGKDFNHILDENFDRAVIYNSEQISGLLKLNITGKNAPLDLINYPQIGVNGIDILFSKEENKYRFNQFWDITKDRGEFSHNSVPMWNTNCAGYKKTINPEYINYFKDQLQRKKFRHYGNSILLRKNVSNDKKMILKLTNSKHLNSSR